MTYFAAEPGDKFAARLWEKIQDWNALLPTMPAFWQARRSALMINGVDDRGFDTSEVALQGPSENLVTLTVNTVRPISQNVVTMVTQSRPTFRPVAKSTDATAQQATLIAKSRLDYYMAEQGLEALQIQAAADAHELSIGYLVGVWDEWAGAPLVPDPETGRMAYEGALVWTRHLWTDVVFDMTRRDSAHDWYAVRCWENKWDWCARYPELAGRIEGLEADASLHRLRLDMSWGRRIILKPSDIIPVYRFFHRPTPSVPGGRQAVVLGPDLMVTPDPPGGWSPLGYDRMPVFRITTDKGIPGTPWHHTNTFDVLGTAAAVNVLTSIPVTNESIMGVQALLVPEGYEFEVKQVANGFPIIHYGKAGKPEAVQWTSTAPEVFKFRQDLIAEAGQTMGLSNTSRGMEDKQMSGARAALEDSVSLRFNSSFAFSYNELARECAMHIIRTEARYIREPRKTKTTGANGVTAADYSGADLAQIDSVAVENVSPDLRTTAGKWAFLQTLSGMTNKDGSPAVTPEQAIGLFETGKLEQVTDGPMSERLLIKRENEALSRGQQVMVSPTDNFWTHIPEHAVVWNSPEARADPRIASATWGHILEHAQQAYNAPSFVLAACGIAPPPPGGLLPASPPGGGMQAPPIPGGPPGPVGQDGGAPGEPPPSDQGPPQPPPGGGQMPNQPSQPQMPTNPASGRKWEPQGGGAGPQ